MIGRRRVICLGLLLVLAVMAKARAEESCADIERNYDLIKPEAVSAQVNAALFAAADSGCEDLARKLISDGASVQARDARGAMPLAHAARGGHLGLVAFFLAKGAPIDARNVAGATALLAAAQLRKNAVVKLLLAKGADPNLAGPSGVTPLIAAAYKDSDRIVQELLARGADPKVRDSTGKSAMVYAAARGSDGIVRRLLDAGIDAKERYGNALTALMWAAGRDDGVSADAANRVVDLLLAHGAVLDAADNRGRTALMIAAALGHAAVVAHLLQHGADRALKTRTARPRSTSPRTMPCARSWRRRTEPLFQARSSGGVLGLGSRKKIYVFHFPN